MEVNSLRIKEIYSGKVAKGYDASMPPFFTMWKKKTFDVSSLKSGDRVLVFCCGTGADFPIILEKIGKNGKIVGVDFSSEMLRVAKEKIKSNKWTNVDLIEADVTKFKIDQDEKFDAGVCTLGISIIPGFLSAYENLVSLVKNGGEIIIGDMQLASGILSGFDPITVLMAKKYGGTHEGHENSLHLRKMMRDKLSDVREREFFFRSYFYCIGRTNLDHS